MAIAQALITITESEAVQSWAIRPRSRKSGRSRDPATSPRPFKNRREIPFLKIPGFFPGMKCAGLRRDRRPSAKWFGGASFGTLPVPSRERRIFEFEQSRAFFCALADVEGTNVTQREKHQSAFLLLAYLALCERHARQCRHDYSLRPVRSRRERRPVGRAGWPLGAELRCRQQSRR